MGIRVWPYGHWYDSGEPSPYRDTSICFSPNIFGSALGRNLSRAGADHLIRLLLLNALSSCKSSADALAYQDDVYIFLGMGLSMKALENSLPQYELDPCDLQFPESERLSPYDFSSGDSCLEIEEDVEHLSAKERKLLQLVEMGFLIDEASSAIEASGPDTDITELMDYISAARMNTSDEQQELPCQNLHDDEQPGPSHQHGGLSTSKKRKKLFKEEEIWENKQEFWRRKQKQSYKKQAKSPDYEDIVHLPKLMIGFGVPDHPLHMSHRTLPKSAVGPPYFYFENVAWTPKGVWTTISRFLYNIEPEFIDSLYFSAAARKRGYIHNLPIENRFPLLPIPPMTIQEFLPHTRSWWPSWDYRSKLNCLQTCHASVQTTNKIRNALESWIDEVPPERTQKYVLYECKKWNLIWTGKNRVSVLEPDEIELLLGYPINHTRGASRTDRYKSLGNSFQVDTVAFHFSVLKKMFPNGISVLSLFSGIGGAEVALHRLGIPLKNVVSVEISEVNNIILRGWWEQTNQKGNLIELGDIQKVTGERLSELIHSLGGFDLIVGGSPCNNLTGSNRLSRNGLAGEQSVLFHEYYRILYTVKGIMDIMS
ncbi:hypothetical protein GIB67_033648 [Kingdonia uniflora]|uniref:DNA (cytosine-5-)-methyltransferase n=1 Tax=Kingdonia uniflora TaxID=39325 RepID=A0A7J7LAU7_9MAGN|nr:hypothetical protein GIB67_033648 [Kingdonia uniflora]